MQYKTLPINSIQISTRVRKDIGDIKSLADNIRELGLLSPIIINEANQLLAGERRLEACKQLGWSEVDVKIYSTEDAEHELAVEFSENEFRKNFTREEEVDAGLRYERIEKVKAEERHATSTGGINPQLRENFPEAEKGRTRDIVAKIFGISGKQYERDKFVACHKELLSPGEYSDWNNRIISTNKAYTIIKNILDNNQAKTSHPTEKQNIKEVIKEVVPQDYNNIKEELDLAKKQLAEKENEFNSLLEEFNSSNKPTTSTPPTPPTQVNDISEIISRAEKAEKEVNDLTNKYNNLVSEKELVEKELSSLRKSRLSPAAQTADFAYDFYKAAQSIITNYLSPAAYNGIIDLNSETSEYFVKGCNMLVNAVTDVFRASKMDEINIY